MLDGKPYPTKLMLIGTRSLAVIVMTCITTLAYAHEFWLQPNVYRGTPGTEVNVSVYVGQNFRGDSLPYIPDWVERFEATSNTTAAKIMAGIGDDPAGRFVLSAPEQYVVSYSGRPESTDIEPLKFKQYLKDAGLEHLVSERQLSKKKSIHEQYVRCAKTIIDAGKEGPVTEPVGLKLEIVPLQNPYRLRTGEKLTVKVLFDGKPLDSALLTAFPRTRSDTPIKVRTDQSGLASVPLHPDEWLLHVVHLVPIDDGVTDWRSYWGSLTFKII